MLLLAIWENLSHIKPHPIFTTQHKREIPQAKFHELCRIKQEPIRFSFGRSRITIVVTAKASEDQSLETQAPNHVQQHQ